MAHFGFIGLGNMGRPMAGRLLDAGHMLTVHDTRAEASAPLVARGATSAASPAAVASAAETVFVSLPTPEIVRHVALGPDGIVAGDRVKVFVDLSTTGARMAQAIARGLAAHGIDAIDAPVSGGVGGAEKGTLAVMVSGAPDRCAALKPVFETLGRYFNVGEAPGLGQTMKLCNNLLAAANYAVSAEAVVMGTKAGLDPAQMIEVINAASGRNSATQGPFARAVLPRSFDLGFTSALMHKDVKLCLDEAASLGLPMLISASVVQMWQLACTEIGGDADFTTLIQCLERWADVEVRTTA